MPRSLVSQAGPLAMRRVLAADATYLKRSLTFEKAEVPFKGGASIQPPLTKELAGQAK
jgi:hypothetical protein